MNQFARIFIGFICIISSSIAADLEIKVNQKSIKLPYWSAKDPSNGGVIIVKGSDPAQWSDFLAHLAQLLATNGWSTALLNCTTENSDVPWLTQLPEAISAMRQAKSKRIILIHYGEQLNKSLDYFSKPQGKMINGLVLLSAFDETPSMVKPSSLRFSILDIVGQFDYDLVLSEVDERKKLFNSPTYLFLEIPGADHEYDYAQDLLVSFLSGWMLKIPELNTAAPPISTKTTAEFYIEPIYSLGTNLVVIN